MGEECVQETSDVNGGETSGILRKKCFLCILKKENKHKTVLQSKRLMMRLC